MILAALLIVGVLLIENLASFNPLKEKLQSKVVPTGYLDRGQLGRALKGMNLVYSVPNDNTVLQKSQPPKPSGGSVADLFPKTRVVGDYLYHSNPGRALDLPSSAALDPGDLPAGWPVISIAIDEEHLFNSATGMLANPYGRSERWERC